MFMFSWNCNHKVECHIASYPMMIEWNGGYVLFCIADCNGEMADMRNVLVAFHPYIPRFAFARFFYLI